MIFWWSILSSARYSFWHICLSGRRFRMRLLTIFAIYFIFTFVSAKSIKDRSRCLPFPIPLITPPVTTIYFFSFLITSASCTLADKRRGLLTQGNLLTNPDTPFKKRIANAAKHTFLDDWFVMLLLAINVTNNNCYQLFSDLTRSGPSWYFPITSWGLVVEDLLQSAIVVILLQTEDEHQPVK